MDEQTDGRRSTDAHCGAHEKNTTDLSAMKSAYGTIKWVLTLGVPVATVIVGAAFANMTSGIDRLETTLTKLNDTLVGYSVSAAEVKVELRQLRTEVEDLKGNHRR